MSTAKIAITIDQQILHELDALVKGNMFPSRSNAIQSAVKEKIDKLSQNRLAAECLKLDVEFEKKIAEEGMLILEDEWPEY
jgi:metal-responsive CopG/Arc/MetJ family transcriptional regulator